MEDNLHQCKTVRAAYREIARKGNLDTLAQLPTRIESTKQVLPLNSLKKRAKSKWYSNKVIVPLLYLESPLHKQYQRAYYCNDTLLQNGNKITGKYCNSRVCHICNRIRTAKFLNGYGQPLKALGPLQFVTLTVPNCSAKDLPATITRMCKEITNTMRVIREKKKIKCSGVRKIEVTYNEQEDTYHPHFHITVDKWVGEMIIASWLDRYPDASYKAQDCRLADQDSFNELFKYSTKIVTGKNGILNIHVRPLDTILKALDRRRTFQTFGTIKRVSEDVEELEAVEIAGIEYKQTEWLWNDEENDWFDTQTGECLTCFRPPDLQFSIYV